jgi:myo-inositol-1(or 4)-monophosphatase
MSDTNDDDPTLDTDAILIAKVAKEAGALAASFFGEKYDQWEKSPGNPVTSVDLEVDDLIKRRLQSLRPAYGWLSEETADDERRQSCSRVWVVDPIDGTRAFIKGRDGFCVSIAMVEKGVPVLGAIYAPLRDQFFQARRGRGAMLNGTRISVGTTSVLENCNMLADAQLFSAGFWPAPWPKMEISKPNSIALRLALVASGQADAAVALRPKSEWDLAAATLILEEAGGHWGDHLGSKKEFNRPYPKFQTVIAAGPGLYDDIHARVKDGLAAWKAQRAARGEN